MPASVSHRPAEVQLFEEGDVAQIAHTGIRDFRISECQNTKLRCLLQYRPDSHPALRSLTERDSNDFDTAVEFIPSGPLFADNGLQKLRGGHGRIRSATQSIDCVSDIDDRGITEPTLLMPRE